MARRVEAKWGGFSRGEDSVTALRDSVSTPNGFSDRMENLIPSAGRLSPRYGSRWVAPTKDLWWAGEYQKASGGYMIRVDGGDLQAMTLAGSVYTILANWIPAPCKISQVRIGKYLLLLADMEGKSLVIEEVAGVLTAFPAMIANPGSPITSLSSEVSIGGTPQPSYIALLDSEPALTGGSFDCGGPRNITCTWVRVEGRDGATATLLTGMPSAQLESWENPGARVQASYAKITVAGTRRKGLMGELAVTISPMAAPASATHLRLYMTMAAPVTGADDASAQEIANGLVYRWVADLPVSMVASGARWAVAGNDGYLAASTNLCWTTGRDDIPPGSDVLFAGGRLWVCGGSNDFNPGKAYFSSIIDGSTDQLSRLLSFDYRNGAIDTSTDESEPMVGMALSQGDLILFNSRSVWALPSANPDSSPLCIDSSRGAVGGITAIGQRVFYLSQSGPAVVSGRVVDSLETFKHAAVWPNLRNGSQFFERGVSVKGIYHGGHWLLSDGRRTACLKLDDREHATWRMSSNTSVLLSCSCSPVKGTVWVGGGSDGIYSLMDPSCVMDGEGGPAPTPFTARLVTNSTHVPGGHPFGEAYSIRTLSWWTDKSQLKISLLGDHGRVSDLYQHDDTLEPGVASGYTMEQRSSLTQAVRQGAASSWFQVALEKNIWGESLFGSISLEILPRRYATEGISISDPGRAEPILDSGFITWDAETTEL